MTLCSSASGASIKMIYGMSANLSSNRASGNCSERPSGHVGDATAAAQVPGYDGSRRQRKLRFSSPATCGVRVTPGIVRTRIIPNPQILPFFFSNPLRWRLNDSHAEEPPPRTGSHHASRTAQRQRGRAKDTTSQVLRRTVKINDSTFSTGKPVPDAPRDIAVHGSRLPHMFRNLIPALADDHTSRPPDYRLR